MTCFGSKLKHYFLTPIQGVFHSAKIIIQSKDKMWFRNSKERGSKWIKTSKQTNKISRGRRWKVVRIWGGEPEEKRAAVEREVQPRRLWRQVRLSRRERREGQQRWFRNEGGGELRQQSLGVRLGHQAPWQAWAEEWVRSITCLVAELEKRERRPGKVLGDCSIHSSRWQGLQLSDDYEMGKEITSQHLKGIKLRTQ